MLMNKYNEIIFSTVNITLLLVIVLICGHSLFILTVECIFKIMFYWKIKTNVKFMYLHSVNCVLSYCILWKIN